MMINKKLNLSLKLNKSLSNVDSGPFTPLDQTLKTPIDPPNQQQQFNFSQNSSTNGSIYSHPNYNESDDILTDSDDPPGASLKMAKNYTLNFTPSFDQLVMSIYSYILSLPTTTPFLGTTPPSGLVSKVAHETMTSLISNTSSNGFPPYDYQSVISNDYLRNGHFQPIFLQLIRKRLIDLCTFSSSSNGKLPKSTTISLSLSGNGNNNLRQSSISNLSMTELNISNYNQNPQNPQNQNRSRSSSMSLRKQSLTRNNSYTGNNWLHVGNLNNIRPPYVTENQNNSSDLLQSMQDFVPQALINKSANPNPNYPNYNSSTTPTISSSGFNSMMMDYQTPPSSTKSSLSSVTPPQNIQIVHTANAPEIDEINFQLLQQRQGLQCRNSLFPNPLTINTESANTPFNMMNGGQTTNAGLESPFMSATTPSDDYGYFSGAILGQIAQNSTETLTQEDNASDPRINLPSQYSLSEKKRDSLKMKRGIH
ncbi:uncharacterized protein PRCAT00001672001 [Priceomyces carsonii]|uniref:uncharacterized protein n=1 Tax=Priceomyces carsonii TaxID=28549 RepID=UPI002ED92786|nr:unnamed protein product [Priceomyces carsonii]